MIVFLTGWRGHTDESHAMARDLSDAMQACGLKRVDAAAAMRLTEPRLSKQLAGVEPLSLWRIGYLPIDVRRAFFTRCVERMGDAVITREEREFVLGFVGAGLKRMAKVAARFSERKVG